MTTEDGPAIPGSAGERTTPGTRTLTVLPDRGTVLVRSAGPPRVPADRCVDVRPGPFATFDGDRLWMPLSVSAGEERRRFERSELPAVEDAAVSALRSAPAVAGEREPSVDGGDDPAVLRFGDRAACRRTLPTAALEAIERRLAAAADRASTALVTWTTGDPRPDDDRAYDVVLDPPVRSD